MKIAQISKEYSANGGVGAYLGLLCPALAASGQQVVVVHADPHAPAGEAAGVRAHFVEGFDRFGGDAESRETAARVIDILDRERPDVVHIQGNNNFLLDSEIRRRFPALKTIHVYEFCPSGSKFHHALATACRHPTGALCLLRMGYKRCVLSLQPPVLLSHYRRCVQANNNNAHYPTLTVASEYVKRHAVASGYTASGIEVLPYFTTMPPMLLAAGRGEPTVLFAGRVVREKGLARLVLVLSTLTGPWRLIVAGDGPDLGRVKRLVRRLGLEGRARFDGWLGREQLDRVYDEASVVALPSLWPEPFGIVGIEAMSHGKPVVAFRVGGIPEWLDDGETGFLVNPGDQRAMAEKIGILLGDVARAREMGLRGRRRAEDRFGQDTHVTRLLETYERAIAARAGARPLAAPGRVTR